MMIRSSLRKIGPLTRVLGTGLALTVALSLSACKEVESEESEGYVPAKLEAVKGADDDLQRVIFTEEGAARAAVETVEIRRAGDRTVIPYAGLIYNDEAKTFVYTSPKPREYVRAAVTVDRIDGDRVLLSKAPPAGTRIVTTGAVEVYGAEIDMAGSH
jgi:hypothetical protein